MIEPRCLELVLELAIVMKLMDCEWSPKNCNTSQTHLKSCLFLYIQKFSDIQ